MCPAHFRTVTTTHHRDHGRLGRKADRLHREALGPPPKLKAGWVGPLNCLNCELLHVCQARAGRRRVTQKSCALCLFHSEDKEQRMIRSLHTHDPTNEAPSSTCPTHTRRAIAKTQGPQIAANPSPASTVLAEMPASGLQCPPSPPLFT